MEQRFTHMEKRQNKISFSTECQFPVATESGPAAQLTQGGGLCVPLCASGLGPHSLPVWNRDSSGVEQMPQDRGLSRPKKYMSNPEEVKMFPNKEI